MTVRVSREGLKKMKEKSFYDYRWVNSRFALFLTAFNSIEPHQRKEVNELGEQTFSAFL